MLLHFIKTRKKLATSYEVYEGDHQLYRGTVPISFNELNLQLFKQGNLIYYIGMSKDLQSKKVFTWRKTKIVSSYHVYSKHKEIIGTINLRRTKTFGGYTYYELILNDQIYNIYEVGCGKEGIKIPIYYGEEQIALIEKDVVVYNNQDKYQITTMDENSSDVACLFNLYYDFVKFGHRGEFVSKTKYAHYEYTMNKELKRKYDPNFKDRI